MVDEDIMSHAQLGDSNLLILPGTTHCVLEVEADHLVLVLGKELLHSLDGALHRDWIVLYTIERAFPLTWVSTT